MKKNRREPAHLPHKPTGSEAAPGLYLNFVEYWRHFKSQRISLRKDPLPKALGLKGNCRLSVWDACCGTGKDSVLMLYMGARVLAFEKSSIVYALLDDALIRARQVPELAEALADFQILYGAAQSISANLEPPEVIYLDPMFPSARGKRLSRKALAVFSKIPDTQEDEEALLDWALRKATKRVVVKRHPKSPYLKSKPNIEYLGKTVRYDVYSVVPR